MRMRRMKSWWKRSWQWGIAARQSDIANVEDDNIDNLDGTSTCKGASRTFVLPFLKDLRFVMPGPEDIIEYEIGPGCHMDRRTSATLNPPLSSLDSHLVLSSNPRMTPPLMPPPPPFGFFQDMALSVGPREGGGTGRRKPKN